MPFLREDFEPSALNPLRLETLREPRSVEDALPLEEPFVQRFLDDGATSNMDLAFEDEKMTGGYFTTMASNQMGLGRPRATWSMAFFTKGCILNATQIGVKIKKHLMSSLGHVRVITTLGSLTISLFVKESPLNCTNFIKLCKCCYYNGQIIYLVEADVFFQTGDPTGKGNGGASIFNLLNPSDPKAKFVVDEIPDKTNFQSKTLKFNRKGLVAMAHAGKNKNASQFFVTTTDRDLDFLHGQYTIIGQVLETDFPVLDAINDDTLLDADHRPLKDLIIEDVQVLNDPFEDPPGLDRLIKVGVSEDRRYKPIMKDILGSYRLSASSANEVISSEEAKRKEAESRALTLEIIGDLKSAEDTPDDNVLFVCKLNPATEEQDLELIFSRFGDLLECHLVKNKDTGESLQYAFIRYKEKASCEEAYFKMNNALIDDRRIHVDFSQSTRKRQRKK